MIHVTKEEAHIIRTLYPECAVVRTMIQYSKRHHYYATEQESAMRAIADSNPVAAELVAAIDRERALRRRRRGQM